MEGEARPTPEGALAAAHLGVEGNDVLHELGVGVPVECLQVVGGHEVQLLLPRHACGR